MRPFFFLAMTSKKNPRQVFRSYNPCSQHCSYFILSTLLCYCKILGTVIHKEVLIMSFRKLSNYTFAGRSSQKFQAIIAEFSVRTCFIIFSPPPGKSLGTTSTNSVLDTSSSYTLCILSEKPYNLQVLLRRPLLNPYQILF